MNNGKICVSVCAETADEFINKAKKAAEIADIVELRFDCLKKSSIDAALESLYKLQKASQKPYLFTFRPKEQGGKRDLSSDERSSFWNSANVSMETWVDMEADIIEWSFNRLFDKRICSHHDFTGVPNNLPEIYQNLKNTKADILKIAVQADDATDSIELWNLLQVAPEEKKNYCLPIAMGEAGKWTRILGPAHGAPLAYASLEAGSPTAPGQISAKDLIKVYRVKELNRDTDIYGVIGNPVSHSLSPYMHNAAFKHHKLNAVYVPFEVTNLDEFMRRMVREDTREMDLNLKGFSV
ncbi:MAG: type I 3-dehydroquinate dehydratase, partial [Pyrinomonadaceae bacterium]|nr:type I 3-dehydroquinate dehydratase [Pyrinomonadaceae bacterium]